MTGFDNTSERNSKLIAIILIAFLTFTLLPIFLDTYYQNMMLLMLFFAYLGSCWNILGGYAGPLSLSHAVFFGIGAYTSTFLFLNFGLSPWVGMFIGGILSVIVGLAIGYPCFRFGVKGPYFALITVAFNELVRLLFINWSTVGGASGLLIPFKEPGLNNLLFKDKLEYYYVILSLLLMVIGITWVIEKSKLGIYFFSVKQNEDAAEAIGISVLKYKLFALSISCFLTAIGGTFYAHYLLYIEPNIVFNIGLSIEIFLAPIIGGMGTIFGPTIGAIILNTISESAKALIGGGTGRFGGIHVMIYGIILVSIIKYAPKGIIDYFRQASPK